MEGGRGTAGEEEELAVDGEGEGEGHDANPLLCRHHATPFLATRETEERHTDWGYSSPIVALDIVWNLVFAVAAVAVMLATGKERPPTPLRAWIVGYAAQCVLHAGFVWLEYRRRRGSDEGGLGEVEVWRRRRVIKRLESSNAVVSFLWWMIGFYWIVVGGQSLLQDAPRLYWLTVVFLAFDVFFAIFCILMACVIGIALCCCLPCIVAILYAMAGPEGASDSELAMLPRFRFREASQCGLFSDGPERVVSILIKGPDSRDIDDLALSPEDSECCICLSKYEDGVELHCLPCKHHFHTGCIVKWLRINATCPLCKYNILKGDELV